MVHDLNPLPDATLFFAWYPAGNPMLGLILLIVLRLAVLGAVPISPYSMSWSFGPLGGLDLMPIVLLILISACRP